MRHAERARWPLLIAGFVVLLLLCVLVFPGLLVDRALRPGQQLPPAERAKAENDVRTTLLQGVAGLLLLAGAIATWRQLRLSREGQITERFTKAISQLGEVDGNGGKKLEVRLGGIYALERIARDSERDHWTIMEVLTAYVRQHAPWPPNESESPKDVEPDERALVTTSGLLIVKNVKAQTRPKPAPDIQAILTVLGRRTRTLGKGEDQRLDLTATDLRGAHLDHAHLEGARLDGAHLERAFLMGVHLEGARFDGAHLEGADLNSAHLEGAHLNSAHLENADLIRAYLENADLMRAHLENANLMDAHLERATLQDAHLERALLMRADLAGASGLTKQQIESAITDDNTKLPDYLALPPARPRPSRRRGRR